MPTYEYRCEACGHTFEEFQSITAEPIKVCPECKKSKVRRLIGTGAAVLFKGSGFYCTDYRSPSRNTAGKTESASSTASSDSGSNGKAKSDGKSGGNGTTGSNGTSGGNGKAA